MPAKKERYDFVIDTYNEYYFEPCNFPTVRAHWLYKGLEKLGYSCFLRKKSMLEWLLRQAKLKNRFGNYATEPIPPARFLINTFYQMDDAHWSGLRKEYEQAKIQCFFNVQGFSIGDLELYFTNQTRWFREHGANLCHTLLKGHKSEREYFIGTGVDPELLKPDKKKTILVECGNREDRRKTAWHELAIGHEPKISIEVFNGVLAEFQRQGYQIVVCGDTFRDVHFTFKPDKKFKYSSHRKFAGILNQAAIYIAKEESYGLPLAETQMAGTVLVLRAGEYPENMVLTEKYSEYEGAKFENGVFVNIKGSAESLRAAIRRAIQISEEKDCCEKIRNAVLNEFDYMAQAKRVAEICLAVERSRD